MIARDPIVDNRHQVTTAQSAARIRMTFTSADGTGARNRFERLRSSPGRARRSIASVVVAVHDNPEEHRYEAVVDGTLAGFAVYRMHPGLIAFVHTEVDEVFEGHGVGSTLVREALEDVRLRGLDVAPICPFVSSFIDQHREYLDLVPASRLGEFGL